MQIRFQIYKLQLELMSSFFDLLRIIVKRADFQNILRHTHWVVFQMAQGTSSTEFEQMGSAEMGVLALPFALETKRFNILAPTVRISGVSHGDFISASAF